MKLPIIEHKFQHDKDLSCRKEIESGLAQDAYRMERILGASVLLMQVMMLVIFASREGGIFFSRRRMCYVSLYALFILVTVVFLLVRRALRTRSGVFQLRVGVCYAAFVCLWACAVTYLDQAGGNGLVVFSYMLPALAALTVLNLRQSMALFGGAFLVLNLTLARTPEGMHNLFSNLINSFALSSLSVIISLQLYQARVASHYNRIVIERQYREIEQANCQLSELAVTDQLTGLNNRRYLEKTVRQRLNGLRGGTRPVAGFMLDLDYFKQYNDNYGHQEGDRCLKAVAGVLLEFSGDEDIYAVRYGGEEFFLCWIGCGRQEAMAGAERLRACISAARGGKGGGTTVSVGVCVRDPWGDGDLDEFVRRADKALYAAKAAGRNCAVLDDGG